MTYNAQEILDLFKNYHFNFDFGYNDIEYFLNEIEYDGEWNYGATKLVLFPKGKDYVIKIPFTRDDDNDGNEFYNANLIEEEASDWDYCSVEETVYQKAKKKHLEKYFAETKCIGSVNGFPIYIQEKCNVHFYKILNKKEKSRLKKKSKKYNFKINVGITPSWCSIFIRNHGSLEYKKLINFLKDRQLGDLHSDNIGSLYKTGKAILIDYSDFREE